MSDMQNQTAEKTGPALYFDLFLIYLKSMGLAFTGGMAAIPILQSELVDKSKYMDADGFLEVTALSQSLPGVIGLNHSILTGYRVAGKKGSVACACGTIFPAFLSMLIVAVIFQELPDIPVIIGMINGIRAVSIAVILGAGLRIAMNFKKDAFSILMIATAVCLPLFTDVSSFYTICITGLVGIAYTALYKDKKDKTK